MLPVARMGVFRYAQVAHRAWRLCVPARCAHTGRRSLNLAPVHAGRWSLLRLSGCRRPVDPRRAGLVWFSFPSRRAAARGTAPAARTRGCWKVLGLSLAAPTGKEGAAVMDGSRSRTERR